MLSKNGETAVSTSKILIKNTLIILLGKTFTQLLSFLLLPLYTRVLSTSDYGVVDLIFTIGALFVPVIILQLDAGLFRSLIEVRGDPYKTKTIACSVFILSFFLCVLYGVIFFIICCFIKIKYPLISFLYVISTIALNLILQYFRGIGNNIFYSVLCCICGACTIFGNLLFLLVFKLKVDGMISAYVLGQAIASFVGFIAFIAENRKIKAPIRLAENSEILKYSLPLILNGVSWWAMNASNRIIISMMLGVGCNGIFSVANKFSSVMFSAYAIFNLSWTEIVSAKFSKSGIDSEIIILNDKINVGLLYVFGLVMNSMFIVYPIFVNKNFSEGYNYIPLLIMAVFFNCIGAQLGGLLVAKKDSKTIAQTSVIGSIMNIAINLLFIKYIGLYAAAAATLVSFFVMYLLRRIRLRKDLGCINYHKFTVAVIVFLISFFCYYVNNLKLSVFIFLLDIAIVAYMNRGYFAKITYYFSPARTSVK